MNFRGGGASKNSFLKAKKTGFTLAEVLITLGVIGIVAAMTLPALINNNRNKQLETAFKRSYSVLSQALDMYQAENGERLIQSQASDQATLKGIMKNYMNVVSDCGDKSVVTDDNPLCIPKEKQLNSYKPFFNMSATLLGVYIFVTKGFITNDGALWLFGPNGLIYVDVNGYNKQPNRVGYDLFQFQIDEKGRLLPMGAEGANFNESKYPCSTADKSYGLSCTIKAITEKDYFTKLH